LAAAQKKGGKGKSSNRVVGEGGPSKKRKAPFVYKARREREEGGGKHSHLLRRKETAITVAAERGRGGKHGKLPSIT